MATVGRHQSHHQTHARSLSQAHTHTAVPPITSGRRLDLNTRGDWLAWPCALRHHHHHHHHHSLVLVLVLDFDANPNPNPPDKPAAHKSVLFTFRSLSFLVVCLVQVGLFLASALLPYRQNRPRSLLATATAVIPSPLSTRTRCGGMPSISVLQCSPSPRPCFHLGLATHQNPPLGPACRQYSLAMANPLSPRETRAKWGRHKPDFSLAKEPRMDKSR